MLSFPKSTVLALPRRRTARSERARKAFLLAAVAFAEVDADGNLVRIIRNVERHPEAFGDLSSVVR
jgi:hypothetical protein